MSGSDRPRLLSERTPPAEQPGEVVSPAEAQQGSPRGRVRGWLFGFAQRMFLLVGFYVLSMGPMYWHWYGGRFAGGSQLIVAFYEPLFILATLVPWFGEWMDWYVGLWIA